MSSSEPPPARRGASSFVTDRPVAITMFVLALGVFGLVSLSKLRVDLLPEISYPTLTVRTSWPGAAPEDVEQRVSERVQEQLSTLPDLVRTTSVSRAGVSDVLLEFEWGTAMTFAVQDVREKLDAVFLPNGVERPLILRYDPNLDPVLRIGVRSARDRTDKGELVQLRWISEQELERDLESIEGVAAVQVRGGLQEEIHVRLDPHRVAALGLDPSLIAQRLAAENINASGGAIREGSTEYLVRTVNEFRTIEEISELALDERNGARIRVADVGEVRRSHARREVVTRLDGREAVELAIYREAGANVVQLAEAVKARLFGTEKQIDKANELAERENRGEGGPSLQERGEVDYLGFRLRKDVHLELLSDQSTFIRAAVDDVKNAAVVGSLLAVLVILLFLRRLTATLIVGLAIPISVVVTFAPMYLFDVTLNIMSLGGLALGVGMLVDNAIVVLESITRCREEGDSVAAAAVRGTREVAGAVTASTLTTIAVFAPIVFVTGIAGQIFGDQALAVVSSLFVSLIVAVMFIPMLASRAWLVLEQSRRDAPARDALWGDLQWGWSSALPNVVTVLIRLVLLLLGWVARAALLGLSLVIGLLGLVLRPLSGAFELFWRGLEGAYQRALRASLAQPLFVLAAAGLLSWYALERVPRLGVELMPEIHQGEFTAHVQLGIGSPLDNTDRVLSELDREVRALPGVATTALTSGVEQETLSREVEGPHTARLTVRVTDDMRGVENELLMEQEVARAHLAHAAVEAVDVRRPTPFALDEPLAVEVKGHALDSIAEVAAEVQARMQALPSLTNVKSSVRPGHPEAQITFDRDKTLEFGLDLSAVSTLVRDQVLGNVPTRFSEGEERIDVRVVGDEVVLNTLDSVLDLVVNPASETPVPLRAVAAVEMVQGPAEIRRIGNTRGVVITAQSTGLDLGSAASEIEAALADLVVPEDVFVELGGQKREMEEAQSSMRFALLLAVFLVYVVMASQFESLVQPLVILVTVPLAGVGVVATLDALSIPLSVVVFIGLIMLAGIVVNNAIVLVDRINQNRRAGTPLVESVVEAGRARLRPILMTTATTALGLLPMTGWLEAVPYIGQLGAGEGAEMRAPMAVTVIAGLISSTLLTLLVIPTVYAIVTRLTPGAQAERAQA